MTNVYDCYRTPAELTMFDFREAWNDYRGADGYSILGNGDFRPYLTSEVEELLDGNPSMTPERIAEELTERHGEKYRVGTLRGCCQGDWQRIIYPARFKESLPDIEQEYFNLCDEWNCVPQGGRKSDGLYCFTYPFSGESTEQQLAGICGCDEVVLHYPKQVYVWD